MTRISSKKNFNSEWTPVTLPDIIGDNGLFVDGDWIESKDQDPNGEVRLIQLADIGDGDFRNKSSRFLTLDRALEIKCTFLAEGDILLARMPDPLGRACIFPLKGERKFVTAVDVAIIRANNKKVNSKFLLYTINNPTYRRMIEDLESGTTRKRISRKNLSTIPFSLPSIGTQIQIVSKIEELFSELDKGIETLKLAQQQLKVYRQSVLKWAFEGRLTNENVMEGELPEGWGMTTIISLIKNEKNALKAGPFGSSLKKEFYVSKGYKIYGQEQVISGNPFLGEYYINEAKYQELETCKVKPNDILISLVGTVGKVLLLPENCKAGIINPRLIKVTLDTKTYLPSFFKYYFESSFVKSFYSAEAKGTTMDVLNLGIIKTIPFPICSTSEQKLIVDEIESRFSVIDKMEESITQSLQQSEALRQSILKRAFEGLLLD